MKESTTPLISKLTVRGGSYVNLRADMQLAGIKVMVEGSYNVALNAFNPAYISDNQDYDMDLEEYCDRMGWDSYETRLEIQEAVENR